MKLRPALLVILLLSGFYYATTHLASAGAFAPWMQSVRGTAQAGPTTAAVKGPMGTFDLTEASAAPAFDAEEQQNIGVYKKALPSVVNITSTEVKFDFFYGPVPQQGQGSGLHSRISKAMMLTNNHVIGQRRSAFEVTLADKHQYKATGGRPSIKSHDLALLLINAPNLIPADAFAESQNLVGRPAGVCDRQSVRT